MSLPTDLQIQLEDLISQDGRYLIPPKHAVFEIKFPAADITGDIPDIIVPSLFYLFM